MAISYGSIEVEESEGNPKTIIGDSFATLFADYIVYNKESFEVNENTKILIYSWIKKKKKKHSKFNYIQSKIIELKDGCKTNMGAINNIEIKLCYDKDDLKHFVIEDILSELTNEKRSGTNTS